MSGQDLDALFRPGSVAVIGASRRPGKVGHDILRNLVEGGYAGTILPVNPRAETLFGRPCLKSLTEWKEGV